MPYTDGFKEQMVKRMMGQGAPCLLVQPGAVRQQAQAVARGALALAPASVGVRQLRFLLRRLGHQETAPLRLLHRNDSQAPSQVRPSARPQGILEQPQSSLPRVHRDWGISRQALDRFLELLIVQLHRRGIGARGEDDGLALARLQAHSP